MAVSHQATGSRSAGGTTTVSLAYPAGVSAGRLAIASRVIKPDTALGSTESGWLQRVSASGGTGTTGADVGLTRVVVDTKVLDGSESGSVTFDQTTSPNSAHGVIQIYTCAGGSVWDVAATQGSDATHGTARAATGAGTFTLAPGDVVLAIVASDTDTATAWTSPAITASGITFGAATQRLAAGGVTTGNQTGLSIIEATVSSGTGAAQPAVSLSGGPSNCGPVAFLRLREVTAAGPSRRFHSDSSVICAVGTGGIATMPQGAWTIAWLARRGQDGDWDTLGSFETSTNNTNAGSQVRNNNDTAAYFGVSSTGTQNTDSANGAVFRAADGWCVVAITKAAGTVAARSHRVRLDGGLAASHLDTSTTHANGNAITGGRLQFGRWQSTDHYGGWIALAGAWNSVLSDADIEGLTAGLSAWTALSPIGLWRFDQASTGTAVVDEIADADQTSLVGTIADADEGPAGFVWAAGDATATPAVIAATATVPTTTELVTAGPAVVTATATVPASTKNIGAGPATTAAAATVPASSEHIGAGPAAVGVVAAVPQATVSIAVNATVTPAAVAATAALPASSRNIAAAPAVLTAAATLTRPDVQVTASPATLAAVGGLAQATVTSATNATATPAVTAATTTLPNAARNVTAGPAAAAATAAVPTPTLQTGTGATATPATIAADRRGPKLHQEHQRRPGGPRGHHRRPAGHRQRRRRRSDPVRQPARHPDRPARRLPARHDPGSQRERHRHPGHHHRDGGGRGRLAVVPTTSTPTVVAATAAIPSSARNVGAGPAVLTATATLTRPDLNISTSPAVLAAAGSLARPNVNVAAGPLVVPLVAVLPQATPVTAGNATVTPAAALVVVAAPQATPLASSAASPAAITAAVTLPGVGASTGASVAVLAALTGLARPSVNVAAGPAVVPVVVGLPAPTILAGGNVTMTPAVVAAVAALTRASVNVVAGPVVLATSAAVVRPLVDVAAGPTTILSAVAIGLAVPQVGAGGNPTPATIAAVAALARPNVNVRAGPLAIPILVALPAAQAGQSISRTPTTLTAVAGLAAVAVSTSAGPPAIAVLIILPRRRCRWGTQPRRRPRRRRCPRWWSRRRRRPRPRARCHANPRDRQRRPDSIGGDRRMSFNVGDGVPLVYTISAAATVVLTVTAPDGTTSTPATTQAGSPPAVSYTAAVAATQAGTWLARFVATGAVTDAEEQQFIVEPTATAGTLYATVGELRDALGDTTNQRLDTGKLTQRLRAASRAVDDWCSRPLRRFWLDPTPTARTYYTEDVLCTRVDDIGSTVGLVVATDDSGTGVFGTTWTINVDFALEPRNAAANGGAYRYNRIVALGSRSFPYLYGYGPRPNLRVTARHGWSQIPDPVREATLLKAIRLNRRPDAPFGNESGGLEMGSMRITREDSDVVALLAPYKIPAGFA